MKIFEKDRKELLKKVLNIIDKYYDTVSEEETQSFNRELRELKKITAAIKKWSTELSNIPKN